MGIAYVNNATGTTDNSSHTSVTLTLAITAGNLVVVSGTFADNGGRDNTITCTDNLGTPTVYNLQLYTYHLANGQTLWTFWGIATTSGTATITINAGSATTFWRFGASQFSGSFPANPVDELASNVMTWTTATDNITSGAKATDANGDLVYGAMFNDATLGATFSAGTGFTARSNAGDFVTEDLIQSGAGSVAATFTSTTTNTGLIHMVAFSEVSGNPGGGGSPRIYADFENSTDGTQLTAAILDAGTHNLDTETWSVGAALTAMKVATAAEKPLLQLAVLTDGSSFSDLAGTRGVTFDVSVSTSQSATMSWDFRSPTAIIQHWFKTTIPTADTGYYNMGRIQGNLGGDFAGIMIHAGQFYLETQANPNGAPNTGSAFNYTADTWYWIEIKFNGFLGGSHALAIYDASGVLQANMTKVNNGASTSHVPSEYTLGRSGDSGTPSALVYYDDLQIDGVNGFFPVSPVRLPGVQATTTTPYIGLWSKDGVLYTGTFDAGIPIQFGLFDDGYVAQFSGTSIGATATGMRSVPVGVFDRDAQVSPLSLYGAN